MKKRPTRPRSEAEKRPVTIGESEVYFRDKAEYADAAFNGFALEQWTSYGQDAGTQNSAGGC